jgi:hypothetical protein
MADKILVPRLPRKSHKPGGFYKDISKVSDEYQEIKKASKKPKVDRKKVYEVEVRVYNFY